MTSLSTITRQFPRHRHRSAVIALLAVALLVVSDPDVAHGERDKRVTPCGPSSGASLNEIYGISEQFITPSCTQVATGGHWWVPFRWATATTHALIPPGHVPVAPTPIQDYVANFVGVRLVIDPGTRQERTFVFPAAMILRTGLTNRDGLPATVWLARLPPLPPGPHVVRGFITMRAAHWDGLGLDPTLNGFPAGESLLGDIAFSVTPGRPR